MNTEPTANPTPIPLVDLAWQHAHDGSRLPAVQRVEARRAVGAVIGDDDDVGDLDPEIGAVPLDVDERIEIGWIGRTAIPLTEQAQRYLAELRTVVSGFGVELLG